MKVDINIPDDESIKQLVEENERTILSGRWVDTKPRKAQLITYDRGIIYRKSLKGGKKFIPSCKRGTIKTFSRASSQRMREVLAKMPELSYLYGVTLTFKKENYKKYIGNPDKLRIWWNLFGKLLQRRAKAGYFSAYFYFVWRIELQTNGIPHYHLIVNGDNADILRLRKEFFEYVAKKLGYMPPDYGFDARNISSCDEAYNYLCSHSSKHKKDQLGWQGRQWGLKFIGISSKSFYKSAKIRMMSEDNAGYELSRKQEVALKRTLKRMYHAKNRNFLNCHKQYIDYLYKQSIKGVKDEVEKGKCLCRIKEKNRTPLKYVTFSKRKKKCRHSMRSLSWRQSVVTSHFLTLDSVDKVQGWLLNVN